MPLQAEANTYRTPESVENPRQVENLRKTEYLKNLVDTYFQPNLEDFIGSKDHPEEIIKRDMAYMKTADRVIPKNKLDIHNYYPVAAELLLTINGGGLFRGDNNGGYGSEMIPTTRIDDVTNRADTAIRVYSEGFSSPMAFDVTTSASKDTIIEKILVNSNDPDLDYQPGLTDIRYFRDAQGNRSWQKRVPKYCVGVDRRTIDEALDGIEINEYSTPKVDQKALSVVSFKTLYEVHWQNRLFLGSLLDEYKDDPNASAEVQEAIDRFGTIDLIVQAELKRLTKELPDDIIQALGQPNKKGEYAPGRIADLFKNPNSPYADKVFTQIITQTQSLIGSYQSADPAAKFAFLKEMAFKNVYDKQKDRKGSFAANRVVDKASGSFYGTRKTPYENQNNSTPPQSEQLAA